MNDLIKYFDSIPTSSRTIFLVSGLAFFLILESGIPLFRFQYNKVKHGFLNIFFTLTTLVVNLIGAGLILAAVQYNEIHTTGLLNWIHLPLWLEVIAGFLILDLIGAWLIHLLEHKVKWMWKFHIIHHTDPYIDVTSGLRHHPGESVFRLLFTSLAVFISGASFGIVMLYQTLSAFFAHLTHANISMPKFIDKIFATVFVTPHYHKIHHHFVQPNTDRNYGNIFSLGDHVFRTSIKVNSLDELTYGLDTHLQPEENSNLKNMLLIPFQEYRPPIGSKFGS